MSTAARSSTRPERATRRGDVSASMPSIGRIRSMGSGAGISGRESNVLHAAAGRVQRDYIARTRDYDEAAWRHHEQSNVLYADGHVQMMSAQFVKDRLELQKKPAGAAQ